MKNLKKLLVVTMCGFLISTSLLATPVFADSLQEKRGINSQNVSNTILSDELVEKINPYVELNSDGTFEITSEDKLLEFLTPEELNLVNSLINSANETNLNVLNDKSGPGTVTVNDNQLTLTIRDYEIRNELDGIQLFSNGVTKVDFYWWGMKVYLSKTAINAASASSIGAAGYLAGKLKVKTPLALVIAAGLGAAGYLGTQIPHGVEVRVNLIPFPPGFVVTKIAYQ